MTRADKLCYRPAYCGEAGGQGDITEGAGGEEEGEGGEGSIPVTETGKQTLPMRQAIYCYQKKLHQNSVKRRDQTENPQWLIHAYSLQLKY